MAGVIPDAGQLGDHHRHSLQGPQVTVEPVGSGALEQRLLDLGELGIPYQHTTVNVVGSYLRENEDVVRRFLKAYVEAIYLYRADKAFTQQVLAEFARSDDPELLEETWELYALRYLERVPYPTLEGIQTVLNESRHPNAKDARPEQFVDARLVRELETAGFFEELRARYGG